jgi:hypothetical protein
MIRWIKYYICLGKKGKGMKKFVFYIFTGIFLFAGCQSENRKQPQAAAVQLPPEIAGIWKAQDSPWQIVLSQDGKVSSAILPLGEVEVKPNQKTMVEMKDGNMSAYTAGNFEVNYNSLSRELEVTIEMKSIHVVILDESLDGNSMDIFSGRVSEDGKIWDTIWFNIFDYGPRFPPEPNAIGEPLKFYKKNNTTPSQSQ